MFNKRRFFIFVGFLFLMFLLMTFAGGPTQNETIATRTVLFIDSINNNEIDKQIVKVGGDAKAPDAPAHNNYVFAGWFDGDIRVTNFTNILKNLTVYAKYAADINNNGIDDTLEDKYTVTFYDTISREVLKEEQVLPGMSATAPRVSVYNDYNFVGWSRSYRNVNSNITVNTVYRLKVEEERKDEYFTVTFIDGIRGEVLDTQTVLRGLTANPPVTPVYAKKVFAHWLGDFTNITSNRTITAIYKDDLNENEIPDDDDTYYNVTFAKGLHGTLSGQSVYNVLTGLTFGDVGIVAPSVIPDTNYKFKEWDITFNNGTVVTANMTITATYFEDFNDNDEDDKDEDKFTVTFDEGDHGTLTGTTSYTVLTGLTFDEIGIVAPSVTPDTNYKFKEWDISFDGDTVVSGDMTITATYFKDFNDNDIDDDLDNHYSVTFLQGSNGNLTGIATYSNILEGLTFTEAGITAPSVVAGTNYKFNKWDISFDGDTVVNGNMTITALYFKDFNDNDIDDDLDDHYTITFDGGANGTLTGTTSFTILSGLKFYDNVTEPTIVANTNWKVIGWDVALPSADALVTSNATYTATYLPLLVIDPEYPLGWKFICPDATHELGDSSSVVINGHFDVNMANGVDSISVSAMTNAELAVDKNSIGDYTVEYEYTYTKYEQNLVMDGACTVSVVDTTPPYLDGSVTNFNNDTKAMITATATDLSNVTVYKYAKVPNAGSDYTVATFPKGSAANLVPSGGNTYKTPDLDSGAIDTSGRYSVYFEDEYGNASVKTFSVNVINDADDDEIDLSSQYYTFTVGSSFAGECESFLSYCDNAYVNLTPKNGTVLDITEAYYVRKSSAFTDAQIANENWSGGTKKNLTIGTSGSSEAINNQRIYFSRNFITNQRYVAIVVKFSYTYQEEYAPGLFRPVTVNETKVVRRQSTNL